MLETLLTQMRKKERQTIWTVGDGHRKLDTGPNRFSFFALNHVPNVHMSRVRASGANLQKANESQKAFSHNGTDLISSRVNRHRPNLKRSGFDLIFHRAVTEIKKPAAIFESN